MERCLLGDATYYFNISSNKIILGKPYFLNDTDHSGVIPECVIACSDFNETAYASLTIYVYTSNRYPPIFNSSFPTTVNLTDVYVPQVIVRTDAYDLDLDKNTDGFITYSVSTIDGQKVVSGENDYIQFSSNSVPILYLTRDPGWSLKSTHTVVVLARDNVSESILPFALVSLPLALFQPFNSSARRTTSQSIKIYYDPVSTTTSVTTPGTGSTSSTSSTTSTATSATTSPTNSSSTSSSSNSTTSNEAACEGIKLLICGDNWIYLIASVSGAIIVIVFLIALCYCLRKPQGRSVYPGSGKFMSPRYQPPPPGTIGPQGQFVPRVHDPARQPNPFMTMYGKSPRVMGPYTHAN